MERVMGIEASLRLFASQILVFFVRLALTDVKPLDMDCYGFDSHKRFIIKKQPYRLLFMERVMGIEPTRPAWKAGILAIELHPHINLQRWIF